MFTLSHSGGRLCLIIGFASPNSFRDCAPETPQLKSFQCIYAVCTLQYKLFLNQAAEVLSFMWVIRILILLLYILKPIFAFQIDILYQPTIWLQINTKISLFLFSVYLASTCLESKTQTTFQRCPRVLSVCLSC